MQSPDASFFKATWGSLKNALIGCSMAAIFALVVLLMSLLSANQTKGAEEIIPPQQLTVMETVQYYLPYPGILPDSSLYQLKALRDKISLTLTTDPLKKAEKELLYADKRIGAAQALVAGGKSSLGVTTATKAEKYLEQSVADAISVKKSGRDSKSLLGTLTKAIAKHLEILDTLKIHVGGDEMAALDTARATTALLSEKVQQALAE